MSMQGGIQRDNKQLYQHGQLLEYVYVEETFG